MGSAVGRRLMPAPQLVDALLEIPCELGRLLMDEQGGQLFARRDFAEQSSVGDLRAQFADLDAKLGCRVGRLVAFEEPMTNPEHSQASDQRKHRQTPQLSSLVHAERAKLDRR